ncbi:MAG TPA: flagellar biosynthetic protein FliO [Pirellulales bacterium]|nr:flagellar biosynthetic protein FliO [Pirellulales bacterium]
MNLKAFSLALLLATAGLPPAAQADGGAGRPRPATRRREAESSAKPGQGKSDTRDENKARQATFTEPVLEGRDATPTEPRRLGARRPAAKTLPPRGDKAPSNAEQLGKARPISAASSLVTGLASLAVVLGLFFTVAWAMRRGMPAGAATLPRQAVEVLGRTSLAGRQYAHLVRCGNKILLVYLAPGVAETLTEITDPAEVDRLADLCRRQPPTSAGASFRRIRLPSGFGIGAKPSVDAREGADA